MDDRWKDEIKQVPQPMLAALAKIACEQTNCCDNGYSAGRGGNCAFCADTAESIIGEFLALARAANLTFPR